MSVVFTAVNILISIHEKVFYTLYLHTKYQKIFLKEINTFSQQGCIKLFKSKSKDIYNVRNIFYFK